MLEKKDNNLDIKSIESIRSQVSSLLMKFKYNNHTNELTIFYKKISMDIRKTKKFLNSNKDLIYLKADKGNISILMNKTDYHTKMTELLSDSNTYKLLDNNPLNCIQNKNNQIAKELLNEKHIDNFVYKQLICHNGVLSKIYGLVKVHKDNFPVRPAVSNSGNPIYELSVFVANLLKPLTNDSSFTVKNSFELINKIQEIDINTIYNHKFVYLDVVALFTNVPIQFIGLRPY